MIWFAELLNSADLLTLIPVLHRMSLGSGLPVVH
jgi:hypothetical protein